jgi:hypothetical protein
MAIVDLGLRILAAAFDHRIPFGQVGHGHVPEAQTLDDDASKPWLREASSGIL